MFTRLPRPATLLLAACAFAACATPVLAPTPAAKPDKETVAVGELVQLDASTSADPNAPALPLFFEWAFVKLPKGSHAALNDTRLVNPSFRADVTGEYVLHVVVSNGVVAAPPTEVKVTAGECGANAPSVPEVSNEPAAPRLGEAVRLVPVLADSDNETCDLKQTHSYAWTILELPAGSRAALNQKDARTPSFVADVAGLYRLAVVATDSRGFASTQKIHDVTVSECGGAAPVVEAPAATPAAPNVNQLVTLAAKAIDADNATGCEAKQVLSYEWFFTALPAGSRTALNDARVESPSFRPDLAGTYVVRTRVSDGTGRATLSEPVTIAASSCGSARPVVTKVDAAPAAPNAGQIVQLTTTVTDADAAEGCALTQSFRHAWRLVAQPAGSHASLNNAGASNPSFLADLPGDYTVDVVVTDSSGLAGERSTATFSVSTCGSARPVAKVTVPASAAIGRTVQVGADVTDADTVEPCTGVETFAYAWSFESLPPASRAALNASGVEKPSFTPDVSGDYVLRLVVTDTAGHTSAPAFATVKASACGGASPVAAASASTTAPGLQQPVRLTASATDADNDETCAAGQTFTFGWSFDALPAGSAARLNSADAVSPSFTPDVPGEYKVRLVATDSTGRRSAPVFVDVTASGCGGAAPTLTVATSTDSPWLGQAVQLTATAEDADNAAPCSASQTLSYAWSFVAMPAGSAARLNDAGAAAPSFTADVAGEFVLRAFVTDSTGRRSGEVRQTVTASTCGGNAPSATVAATPATPAVGAHVRLSPTVLDADNQGTGEGDCQQRTNRNPLQTFTFAWTLLSAPSGSAAALASSTSRDVEFTADEAGAYVLRLVVTDSTGRRSAPVEKTVTVDPCGTNAPEVTDFELSSATPNTGALVTIEGFVDDLDNAEACAGLLGAPQALSSTWELVAAPLDSRVQLQQASALEAGFVPDVPGTYEVALAVTDSTGRRARSSVTITAAACGSAAPTVAPATGTLASPGARVGGVIPLLANGADADNASECGASQALSYDWALVDQPAGSRAQLNAPDIANPSFTPDVAGTWTFQLAATDSTGRRSAVSTFSVPVGACGGFRPVASVSGPPGPVTMPVGGVDVQFDALAVAKPSTDGDNSTTCALGQALSFRWELFTAPLAADVTILPSATVSNPTLRVKTKGDYTLRLWVTDSTGLVSDPSIFAFRVN